MFFHVLSACLTYHCKALSELISPAHRHVHLALEPPEVMGFHCNFWNQKISQTKTFRLGYFLGPEKTQEKQPPTQSFLCWGLFWATFLGPCWVIWWALWGSMWSLEGKNNPQHKSFCVEGYFGRLFGTMLGHVGPFWVHVAMPKKGIHGHTSKFPATWSGSSPIRLFMQKWWFCAICQASRVVPRRRSRMRFPDSIYIEWTETS